MTGAAFLLGVVVRGLGRVARAAKRSRGCELRDGCGRVAGVASLVRHLERRVGGFRVGERVASRTRAAGRMMIAVTVLTLGSGR